MIQPLRARHRLMIHSDYALKHSNIPMGSQIAGRYTVHFAQNAIEVDAALKLRFDVFNLSALSDSVLDNAIEVGRVCIASEHRNSRVLFLLWRGLAMYMTHMQKRYLFGCCSLTSQDPDEGNLVAAYLQQERLMHPSFWVMPRPEFVCDGLLPNGRVRTKLPRLFQIYLDHRAKVCSPPAIDRLFKTIDFLVMLDLEDLDPRVRRLYFG